MKKVTFLIFYLFFTCLFYANNTDSLLNEIKNWESKNSLIADSILYNTYYELGSTYQNSNPDTAIYYFNKAKNLSKKLNNSINYGEVTRNIAWCMVQKSDYEKALILYNEALTIVESNRDHKKARKLESAILGNIGIVYRYQSDYPKALEYYFKSLKINEELERKSGIAANLGNIGVVYRLQSEYSKALNYFLKALKINEELENKNGMAINLGNIGNVYSNQSETHSDQNQKVELLNKALEYYFKALEINEELKRKSGIATNLGNIGIVNVDLYKISSNPTKKTFYLDKALEYFLKALKIDEEIEDKNGVAVWLGNIGSLYTKTAKYNKAEEFLNRALALSTEIGALHLEREFEKNLFELYEATAKHKLALIHYKKYITLNDSIESEENQKEVIRQEFKYNYEKKAAIDSIANAKEKEIKDAKIAQQQTEIKAKRNQQYALFGGMFLVIVFAGVMYNRFRVTRKQKVIIEEKERETHAQKEIIEEKHKEITDSINYAERIQRSFLATKEILDENLKEYFVLFRPKDVVSGDFYWAAKLNNGNFAFACADSTGHGVPGAIMSILNISSLEKSIETQTEPHKILHETRKIIINRLKKDGSAEGGKDGMDCSLLVLNQEKTHLTFASANNSVFIIRNGEILEFKGDKMPVGKHDNADEIFTLHSVDLQKGDVIYSLTDGFPDQFGGNKGKKYMIKNLKNLLLEIAPLPLKEQEEKLANEFDKWKGNEEQVDDVCIIGVRV